ncbi:MAG: hypothetical protein HQL69_24260 [Magnetococcales bacterium]|nr:hypothetical protein [Magnetococcales bacterium]
MGKSGSKNKLKQDKSKKGKKALKERISILEEKLAALETQVGDQLEQLSERNAALLRKTG